MDDNGSHSSEAIYSSGNKMIHSHACVNSPKTFHSPPISAPSSFFLRVDGLLRGRGDEICPLNTEGAPLLAGCLSCTQKTLSVLGAGRATRGMCSELLLLECSQRRFTCCLTPVEGERSNFQARRLSRSNPQPSGLSGELCQPSPSLAKVGPLCSFNGPPWRSLYAHACSAFNVCAA